MLLEIEGLSPVIVNIAAIGVVTLLFYFLTKPTNQTQRPQRRQHQAPRQRDNAPSRNQFRSGGRVAEIPTVESVGIAQMTRTPPHMASASAAKKVAALSSEGMLHFRHCSAAGYESLTFSEETITANRKERARLLSRILGLDKTTPPPPRGSTVVVSIPSKEIECSMLRRVLYLLSTYFNLVVILSVSDKSAKVDSLLSQLRGTNASDLPKEVLADHRIIVAQSLAGRIALVRQLGKVEFVLEFDEEVRSQLSRFGFRVLVYGHTDVGGLRLGALLS